MAHFPSRQNNALSGSQFIQSIISYGKSAQISDLIVQEILKGNIPDFIKQLVPITISEKGNTLTYKVTPDYLAIGDNYDYVRVPLGGPAAQKIADAFGCILPTPKMSDQIWKAAKIKLAPKPLSVSNINISGKTYSPQQMIAGKMMDTEIFEYHNQLIQQQLKEKNHQLGELVAGSKKDVVLSNDLIPGRLAIHGMHEENGKPIQQGGLSKHNENYYDYSSGIRLVDRQATLNGKEVDMIKDILQNQQYAYLVNDGVLTNVAYNYNKDKNIIEESKDTMEASTSNMKGTLTGRMLLLDRINKYLDSIKI
jgi:hypothetical protein